MGSSKKGHESRNESAVRQQRTLREQRVQPRRQDLLGNAARHANPSAPRIPEAIAEATAEEARRLEEVVGALGEESPHAKPLLVALRAARAKLNVPVSVQIESTAKYLERARKRLVQAEAKSAKVAAQKDEGVAEVDAAERRLERLIASAPMPIQHEPMEAVFAAESNRRLDSRTGLSVCFCESSTRRGCWRSTIQWRRRDEQVAGKRGGTRTRNAEG